MENVHPISETSYIISTNKSWMRLNSLQSFISKKKKFAPQMESSEIVFPFKIFALFIALGRIFINYKCAYYGDTMGED